MSIALPLRNQDALTDLLEQTYDRSSTNYHQYLTPADFIRRFGPAEQDYEAVIQFARTNGLEVVARHENRLLLHVTGSVADIERAFSVVLRTYRHPTEPRTFYAPDQEPSVDARLKVLSILGLDNEAEWRTPLRLRPASAGVSGALGSGAQGTFFGGDFRRAYAPGTTLNGAGQMLGLVEFDAWFANSIVGYERDAGLPSVPIMNVLLDKATGVPSTNFMPVSECTADIEMAIAMAPGLKAVVVFQAPDVLPYMTNSLSPYFGDILGAMASSNQIKQLSSSWGYEGSPNPNLAYDQIFQQMALQGQSFFQASGDADAWVNAIWVPAASPYVTCVGATTLSMNSNGVSYGSESVWNSGTEGSQWGPNSTYSWGSGGGVSTNYAIPSYQAGLNMTTNHGSTVFRNIPDVTMVGNNIWETQGTNYPSGTWNGIAVAGTSLSAPLWAGFAALANEQAAAYGEPAVGFINPALYAIGKSSNFNACFHDIVLGNNTGQISPTNYYAVPGFDLCAGWGSPSGTNLINALSPLPLISPTLQSSRLSNGAVVLTWSTLAGLSYQLQYATDLATWSNLGPAFVATNSTANSYDIPGPAPQRFYRVMVAR